MSDITTSRNHLYREQLIAAALTGILANPYTLNDQKVVIDAIFKVVDGVLERLESESK